MRFGGIYEMLTMLPGIIIAMSFHEVLIVTLKLPRFLVS